MITRKELNTFFTTNQYEWVQPVTGLIRLYSPVGKCYIYLRSRRKYSRMYIYLLFALNSEFFSNHWRVSYLMLKLQVELNRQILKPK